MFWVAVAVLLWGWWWWWSEPRNSEVVHSGPDDGPDKSPLGPGLHVRPSIRSAHLWWVAPKHGPWRLCPIDVMGRHGTHSACRGSQSQKCDTGLAPLNLSCQQGCAPSGDFRGGYAKTDFLPFQHLKAPTVPALCLFPSSSQQCVFRSSSDSGPLPLSSKSEGPVIPSGPQR